MALKLSELRKQAKDMGIPPAVIRPATTPEELQSVIEDYMAHDGGTKVAPRKKVAKKTVARKAPVRKSVARKSATRKTTARKATVGNSARKASTPAKSRKSGTAKRSSKTAVRASAYVPKGGRNTLDGVEYGDFEGWNARPGSPPDRIIKALKKFRGNREKVFDFLAADIWDFMGKTKRDGTKRTKAEAEAMLRYRISRTAWDFAMRTGQHDAAANREKYGTAGTGRGVWKPAKARKAAVARKSAPARKSAVKTRTAQRAAGGRKKATARKRTTTRR